MPTALAKQAPCPPRRARFVRGLKLGLPILLGYAPVGAAFGILADGLGFTAFQAALCSATALAGAGQFIALALAALGTPVLGILVATAIVNLRYVLFGAVLSPYLSGMSLHAQGLLAFTLTDETFAVNIQDQRQGSADALSMAGVGTIAWIGWVAGTLVGALAAGLIGDPERWGVQFAMAAMFSALLVAQVEDKRHVIVAVITLALTLAFMALLPGQWYVVLAPVAAAAIAAVVYR